MRIELQHTRCTEFADRTHNRSVVEKEGDVTHSFVLQIRRAHVWIYRSVLRSLQHTRCAELAGRSQNCCVAGKEGDVTNSFVLRDPSMCGNKGNEQEQGRGGVHSKCGEFIRETKAT